MAENLSKAMKNFHGKLGLAWPALARPSRRPKGANIEHILVWHAIITESRRNCESNAKCVSKFKHWKRERKTDNCLQPGVRIGGGGDSTHVRCEL